MKKYYFNSVKFANMNFLKIDFSLEMIHEIWEKRIQKKITGTTRMGIIRDNRITNENCF